MLSKTCSAMFAAKRKSIKSSASASLPCHNNNNNNNKNKNIARNRKTLPPKCGCQRLSGNSDSLRSCSRGVITCAALVLLLASNAIVEGALRNVNLIIEPPAVRRGQHAIVRCLYDLDGAPLYSAKFYRGQLEFYRYTPGEFPNTKVFPFPGIHVDVTSSNATQVLIRNVGFGLSGNFSCEITADAPLFSTATATGILQVVELPEKRPTLFTDHTRYEPGDVLRANCSTPPSRPRAELKLTINNMVVSTPDTQYIRTIDNLIASRISLKLQLQAIHFANANPSLLHGNGGGNGNGHGYGAGVYAPTLNSVHGHSVGSLVLRCTAQIGDLYQEYKEIELGTPQKDPVPARVTLSSGSSMSNFFGSYFSSSAGQALRVPRNVAATLLLAAGSTAAITVTAAAAAEMCVALLACLNQILTYSYKLAGRPLHSAALRSKLQWPQQQQQQQQQQEQPQPEREEEEERKREEQRQRPLRQLSQR